MGLGNASLIIIPHRGLIRNSEGDFSSECMGIYWPRMLTRGGDSYQEVGGGSFSKC